MEIINKLGVIETENLILDLAKVVYENRKLRKRIEELNEKRKEGISDITKEHIDFLKFPSRIRNSLLRKNIDTIEKLCSKTYDDIYKLRGMGENSLNELI